jgi:YHS domain-containing protein
VAGGIDFVDLAGKTQGKDAPAFGDASHKTTLNGFPFHFTSDANRAAFDADPWTYAPAWGGF